MVFNAAGLSDIGRKRKVNQDSMLLEPSLNLFVVADGMGGHAGGETASRITIETISKSIGSDKGTLQITPQELIMTAVHRANSSVFSEAEKNKGLSGMGTTVVAMYFDQNKLFVAHVGDSRVYMLRKGKIWQLTKDHSLVNEKLKAGLITRDQLKRDKSRNVITRSVGFESSVLVDIYEKEINQGDMFLACSDGLSGMLEDREILALVDEFGWDAPDLNVLVKKLIEGANNNGGDDNVSTIVVRID